MAHTLHINELINQIDRLNYSDKIIIMEQIVKKLKQERGKTKRNPITRIKGLGKELWNDIDVDSYVAEQRESWD